MRTPCRSASSSAELVWIATFSRHSSPKSVEAQQQHQQTSQMELQIEKTRERKTNTPTPSFTLASTLAPAQKISPSSRTDTSDSSFAPTSRLAVSTSLASLI